MKTKSERPILIVGTIVGVMVFGYIYSLFTAAQQADVQVNVNNERLVHNLIRNFERGISEFMTNLIVSDRAFDSVESSTESLFFTATCSGERFGSQIAAFGLVKDRKIEFLCTYGQVKNPAEHSYLSQEISPLVQTLSEKVAPDQDKYGLVLSELFHLTDYVTVDGRTYLVFVGAISPQSNRKRGIDYKQVFAFAMVSLDRTIITQYSEMLSLGSFRVVNEPEALPTRFSSPVKSRSGNRIAYMTWDASREFQDLLKKLLPSIAILTMISLLLVIRYLREIGKLQRVISDQVSKARHMALHDTLTGLPNRAHFTTAIKEAVAEATVESPCFVGFLDLDNFKLVNDTNGHSAGDNLIIEAGNRLKSELDDSDIIARLGGDEFAFVVRSAVTEQQVRSLCERIIMSLKQPLHVANTVIEPSASLGVATCPKDGTDAGLLLKKADQALYSAKNRGRGCFAIYNETQLPVRRAVAAE